MAHSWQGEISGTAAAPPAQRRRTGAIEGDIKEILASTVRLSLQTVQRMRAVEACVYDVMIGPSGDPVPSSMLSAQKLYPDLVKKAGKGHGMGEPPAHAWAALIFSLSTHQSVSTNIREELKAYYATLVSPKDISKEVKYCKCMLLYDKAQCKIQFSFQGNALTKRKCVMDALLCLHFGIKDGQAPRNHLERQLQTFLDAEV